ncbi:glutamate racemase [Ferroacidibacillus organovorans]|uniref:Glutamate racemase n=1 Tax=Ferroacidibacillus organovorans TaxID=1765683 RepID=A0A853KAF2_9BACL|nr:glutamate racemase [Ferroacidibacillus organovorans]KYP80371.1 glutamate racemase [Ferroacidibacillus organovorans]OAG93324.1 glutamate racemase [Ferroacidibacillus organovorans]
MRNQPIGVMDSGVGGMTVVAELFRQLPRESILFYGDSARCPYGNRPAEEIRAFTFEALDYLVLQGVKMLVIACNTATAICLSEARERYAIPVIGVISPGARAAIAATTSHRIGVIGTRATIESDRYARALQMIHPDLFVASHACPRFVDLVESGRFDDPAILDEIEKELLPLQSREIDTLILGCTHYPLLADAISVVMGERVTLINSAEETARDVSHWLSEENLMREEGHPPTHVFLTSGEIEPFREIALRWLGFSPFVSQVRVWEQSCFDSPRVR